ncbi:protein-export chaperone SecB [Rhodothalassium salexigens DSM 2132]|nr:protein-export chaperone SecB [Rhodothalassium salexigens DSM 2132]
MTDKSDTMAEETTGPEAGSDAQPAGGEASVAAQYVKDLSFENPNAPQTLYRQPDDKPNIDVSVNVQAQQRGQDAYEVELKISATSKTKEDTPTVIFAVEVQYAGLFMARNLSDAQLQQFLLIAAPQMLFPFARRIIADAVRDGGFPPLMLDPIDFHALYQQQRQQIQQQQTGDAPTLN